MSKGCASDTRARRRSKAARSSLSLRDSTLLGGVTQHCGCKLIPAYSALWRAPQVLTQIVEAIQVRCARLLRAAFRISRPGCAGHLGVSQMGRYRKAEGNNFELLSKQSMLRLLFHKICPEEDRQEGGKFIGIPRNSQESDEFPGPICAAPPRPPIFHGGQLRPGSPRSVPAAKDLHARPKEASLPGSPLLPPPSHSGSAAVAKPQNNFGPANPRNPV